jgi:peptidoglycan/LPS O-acetylase OafA/YrhL
MSVVFAATATPLFRAADTPPSPQPNRVVVIDGLRGFLALGVVFHHVAVYHEYLVSGRWETPPEPFYAMLGPMAVSLFFMITGYLFWGRLIRTKGKPGWIALYINRLFRIAPLYLVAVVAMLAAVAVLSGFTLHVGKLRLIHELGRWLGTFGVLIGGEVNGYTDADVLLARVTWTIQFEWFFYFSLPVLSLATRGRRWHLPFASLASAACVMWIAFHASGRAETVFAFGMLCASLQESGLLLRIPNWVSSVAILALMAGVYRYSDMSGTVPFVLLGLVFYLVVSGASIFGVLTSRAARRLGDISYGIYLLHGLVLAAVFWPPATEALAIESPFYHWGLALVAILLLIALATSAHVAVERPGIALGRLINKHSFAFFKI